MRRWMVCTREASSCTATTARGHAVAWTETGPSHVSASLERGSRRTALRASTASPGHRAPARGRWRRSKAVRWRRRRTCLR
eukprot:6881-Alexandrium_andersonii.AAC.1